ncbi:hypothetical protein ABTX62_31520 [Streptomyces sp. NPDC096046]|uniref:hypothetical protein n=1 Tax=Streptomyces sp. NPDC096046 TaxID=3155542 RepID=UPI00331B5F7F
MSEMPLTVPEARGGPVTGHRHQSPAVLTHDQSTRAPAAGASEYTSASAKNAAAALMRLLHDAGVFGFGIAEPEFPGGGTTAGAGEPVTPPGPGATGVPTAVDAGGTCPPPPMDEAAVEAGHLTATRGESLPFRPRRRRRQCVWPTGR